MLCPTNRDRGATLGLGEAPLVIRYSGGTRHFFLLTRNNFKNIGGHVSPPPPLQHPLLRGP